LAKIEAEIQERKEGPGWGKTGDLNELENKKAVHMKTKPK